MANCCFFPGYGIENRENIPIGLIAMCSSNSPSQAEVDIYHISAFIAGRGEGSEMLHFLCDVADEYGVRLCIEATALFNGNKTMNDAALVKWYGKYGFKGNSSMHREPLNNRF